MKKIRIAGYPDLEECLIKCVKQCRDCNLPIGGNELNEKAEQVAQKPGYKAAMDGWKTLKTVITLFFENCVAKVNHGVMCVNKTHKRQTGSILNLDIKPHMINHYRRGGYSNRTQHYCGSGKDAVHTPSLHGMFRNRGKRGLRSYFSD
ncbi:hypothetical protein AVEN_199621-1 [Araneus ventricosus]|uniref:Uncharacterized protein n=1 Tax=Araneus ventricosus TaxID=182803 RepID=A0A4Y2DGV2_ARAVE|nr:hypothetical protein AVEN_199621-1 [Araneus ventricosus]